MPEAKISALPIVTETMGAIIGYFLDEKNRYRGIFYGGFTGLVLGFVIDKAILQE